jgi:hypothetical protein
MHGRDMHHTLRPTVAVQAAGLGMLMTLGISGSGLCPRVFNRASSSAIRSCTLAWFCGSPAICIHMQRVLRSGGWKK